jgi:hypothetical protein
MESGHNSGSASCTRCQTFLHLTLERPEDGREVMKAQTWIQYRWRVTKDLPWDDHNLIMYRSDLLSERIRRQGWSLLRAVRYALKQGQFRTTFLSGLTFHPGAGKAMREVAVYDRRKASQTNNPEAVHHINLRVDLLEGYAGRCAPVQPEQP